MITRRNLLGTGAAAIAATGLEAAVLDTRAQIPRPPQRGAVPDRAGSRLADSGHTTRSGQSGSTPAEGFPIEFEPHDASGWRNGI
jgi:hypothetical protein